MYKSLLEKQFQIDFNCKNFKFDKNLFVTATSNLNSRYWARGEGNIVCTENKLFVRTENKKLTEELKSIYSTSNVEWFLDVNNLKQLSNILKSTT